MSFFKKRLIGFRAMEKHTRSALVSSVMATIATGLCGYKIVSIIFLIACACFIAYMLTFSIACIRHRKKCQRFRVYLSFSERRIPQMVMYIDNYLKHAFWVFNIDYYDFREHERFHYLDEPNICNEIDKNLAVSDIFLRIIDHGLEPNKTRLVSDYWNNVILNPFTRSLSEPPDYTDYEVNASFDKFGFNNRNNRFQIMPLTIMTGPMGHTQTIYKSSEESDLDFTLELINRLSHGYSEQLYWKRSALFWEMRDQLVNNRRS